MKATAKYGRRPPREPVVGVSLLLLVFTAVGCNAEAQHPRAPRPGPAAPNAAAVKQAPVLAYATPVKGKAMRTEGEAREAALEEARSLLINYLRELDPPVYWTPSPEYVKRLVKDEKSETKTLDPDIGKVYWANLRLEVTAADRDDMQLKGREYRMGQRLSLLAKGLGGIVVLLTLIAGYIRIDEWSKGYYTGWLRLAAVGAVVGGAVWLLIGG